MNLTNVNNRATSANIVDKNTKILKVNEKRKPKMLHNRKNSNINLNSNNKAGLNLTIYNKSQKDKFKSK